MIWRPFFNWLYNILIPMRSIHLLCFLIFAFSPPTVMLIFASFSGENISLDAYKYNCAMSDSTLRRIHTYFTTKQHETEVSARIIIMLVKAQNLVALQSLTDPALL